MVNDGIAFLLRLGMRQETQSHPSYQHSTGSSGFTGRTENGLYSLHSSTLGSPSTLFIQRAILDDSFIQSNSKIYYSAFYIHPKQNHLPTFPVLFKVTMMSYLN